MAECAICKVPMSDPTPEQREAAMEEFAVNYPQLAIDGMPLVLICTACSERVLAEHKGAGHA